jgi:amino acid transporter
LVSRSLGPSTGGAIGILYYLASAFSTSLNLLGAIETFILITGLHLGPQGFSERLFALILLIILVACNFFSVRILSKTSFVIILFVFSSIITMLIGLFSSKSRGSTLN